MCSGFRFLTFEWWGSSLQLVENLALWGSLRRGLSLKKALKNKLWKHFLKREEIIKLKWISEFISYYYTDTFQRCLYADLLYREHTQTIYATKQTTASQIIIRLNQHFWNWQQQFKMINFTKMGISTELL